VAFHSEKKKLGFDLGFGGAFAEGAAVELSGNTVHAGRATPASSAHLTPINPPDR